MIKLSDILNELLNEKKLCPKGRAYYNRRIAAGEKPSAYLSGRAVKVCKGLMEDIDPEEAQTNIDSVQTIVDGKRNIAFVVEKGDTPKNWERVTQMVADNELKSMYVKGNPHHAYVVYTPEAEKIAIELKTIAEKYNGYLSSNATAEDTRRIGQLLDYDPEQIELFIKDRYIDESLRDWFEKEDWVRIDTAGNITGPCGTMKKGKATTRCLPRAKANSLTKAERAATSRKKVAGSKKGKQFVPNTKKAKVSLSEIEDPTIQCEKCDHSWKVSQSDPSDLYICHNCGFNNSYKYNNEIDEYDVENEQDIKEFIEFMREYQQQLNEADCNCLLEAEYRGRKVTLGKPMQGDIKKFKVYVKNDKGKVVKVNFGFGGKSAKGKRMVIKAKNPKRRAAYRARHNCDNPGPRWKANYWSCKKW
jgi:hypothetical protein